MSETQDSETAAGGPKHPGVHVQLTGKDGNAFAIIARCSEAARKAGVPKAEIDRFCEGAMDCEDYDSLLRHTIKWFDVR